MKNYLVTGGTDGIGKALVKLLLKDVNNYVINLDIKDDSYQNVNLKFIKTDLSDQQQVFDAVKQLKEINFDGLFLNAGVLVKGSIFDVDIETIKKAFEINVWGSVLLIKGLKSQLKKGSSIVFNGSDQCFVAKPKSFAYTISKGAIAQMTKSLALDLASENICVNAICPGTVNTALYRDTIQNYADKIGISFTQAHKGEEQEFPLGRIASPEEIAELVSFLLSDKSKFMTGGLIPIDGGYTAQ